MTPYALYCLLPVPGMLFTRAMCLCCDAAYVCPGCCCSNAMMFCLCQLLYMQSCMLVRCCMHIAQQAGHRSEDRPHLHATPLTETCSHSAMACSCHLPVARVAPIQWPTSEQLISSILPLPGCFACARQETPLPGQMSLICLIFTGLNSGPLALPRTGLGARPSISDDSSWYSLCILRRSSGFCQEDSCAETYFVETEGRHQLPQPGRFQLLLHSTVKVVQAFAFIFMCMMSNCAIYIIACH